MKGLPFTPDDIKYGKLWSTQPKQYKFLDEAQAIEQYANYLSAVAGSLFGDNNLITINDNKE